MRIVYFAGYFYPEEYAGSYVFETIVKQAAKGNEVYVITPQPTKVADDKSHLNYKEYEEYKGIKIYRFPMKKEPKGTLGRFLRYFICNFNYMKYAKKIPEIDCVFSGSTPPILGLAAGTVARKRKVPFVYSLQDVFPDSLISTGLLKKKSGIIWKVGRLVENITYSLCSKIAVISEDMKANLIAKNVPEGKITIIRNFTDLEGYVNIERKNNPLFSELGLDESKFYVMYAGNFGKAQNLSLLLETAKMLKNEKSIHFLLIGNGFEEDKLKEYAATHKLENVSFFPMQSAEKVAQVYNLPDVAVVMCRKGTGKSSMPSKTWTIMSCETPLIVSFDSETEMERVITKSKSGLFVEADDSKLLKDAILKFKNSGKDIAIYGKNGREFVEKNLSEEHCMAAYMELLGVE